VLTQRPRLRGPHASGDFFAGLWSDHRLLKADPALLAAPEAAIWRSPDGEWMRSFAIITTTPNELCAELHNRMPVVLKPEAWPVWLGEEPADQSVLKALLAPFRSDEMICWPVNARVGSVKNNDVSLIELINAVSH
jgi:putative SOS response-associated peptidase YedK